MKGRNNMKANQAILMTGVLTAILANECCANFNGSDDFNDDSKDPARWGTDLAYGSGLLTETNGRLEYTTSGFPTGFDMAARPWVLNYGSSTQNWEVHMDVSVPISPFQEMSFSLMVFPGTDPNAAYANRFMLDLDQFQDSGSNQLKFHCTVTANEIESEVARTVTASSYAALRIAFDANTKLLSAFYDEDGPNCGYSWTFLGSTNLPAAWNMTGTNIFGILAVGGSKSASVVPANNVYGDNFCASSGAMPNLGINLASGATGQLVLSWPTNAPACHVEFAGTLTPPICWQVITNAPGIVGAHFTVTNPGSSDVGFYRLSR